MNAVWCEIVCAECSRTTAGRFVAGGRYPVRKMNDEARGKGWTRSDDEHYCAGCTHERETGHRVYFSEHGGLPVCTVCSWPGVASPAAKSVCPPSTL